MRAEGNGGRSLDHRGVLRNWFSECWASTVTTFPWEKKAPPRPLLARAGTGALEERPISSYLNLPQKWRAQEQSTNQIPKELSSLCHHLAMPHCPLQPALGIMPIPWGTKKKRFFPTQPTESSKLLPSQAIGPGPFWVLIDSRGLSWFSFLLPESEAQEEERCPRPSISGLTGEAFLRGTVERAFESDENHNTQGPSDRPAFNQPHNRL